LDVTIRASVDAAPVIAYSLRNEANTAAASLTDIRAVGLSAVTSPDVAIDILLEGTVTVEGTVFVNIVDSSEVDDSIATFTADTDMTAVDATITSPEFLIDAFLRGVNAQAENEKDIFLESDIDVPLIGTVQYVGKAPLIPLSTSFATPNFGTLRLRFVNRGNNVIAWVPSTALFSMENSTAGYLGFDLLDCIAQDIGNNATIFDIRGSHISQSPLGLVIMLLNTTAWVGFSNIGTIRDAGIVDVDALLVSPYLGSGLKLINVIDTIFTDTIFNTPISGLTCIEISGIVEGHDYTRTVVTLPAGTAIFRIDPGIPDDGRVIITRTNASTGVLLFDTTGVSGSFTAVADAAIASTAITSVSEGTERSGGSGFVARFNFSGGGDIFKGQQVELSGFSSSAYNATGIITETDAGDFSAGTAWFEIFQILEQGDETGVFESNVVTITLQNVGTMLTSGDTVTVDTFFATDYDGGTVMFNVLTDSFGCNRAFTSTQTGAIDSGGLDHTDPRILASDNPDFADSRYIVCGFVNNNLATMSTLTADEYNPMNFTTGTGDNAFKASGSVERWKLIDQATGTFIYFGNEPFDGDINFSITLAKTSGSNVDYDLAISNSTDDGTSFTPLEAITSINIGNNATKATSLVISLTAAKGDLIRPEIQPANTDTVAATFFSMFGST
jgi:hypothetical protein